jgi:hypothetical protein
LKDKIKIVRAHDWLASGSKRHRTLRENSRPKKLERAPCFFQYLVYGAIPIDGQFISRGRKLDFFTNVKQHNVQLLTPVLEPDRLLSGCHMPALLL